MSRLGARLLRHAKTDARAVFADRWWTYRELVDAARALTLDVSEGDVVAIPLARGIEPVIAVCAAAIAGAVPAMIDPEDAGMAARALAHLRPAAVIGRAIDWEPVRRPGLAFVVFTSGSTADGKAVAWSEARARYDWVTGPPTQMQRAAPGGIAVPLCTALGLQDLARSLHHGLETVLLDVPFRVGLEQARALGVNRLRLTPTHVDVLLNTTVELPALRRVLVASAPIDPAKLRALATRLPHARVGRTYGLTESGAATILWADKQPGRLRTVGRAVAYRRITIRDKDGRVLPPQTWGEVVIEMPVWDRGDGYLDAPEALARRFDNAMLWTGDRGKLDAAGFLVLGGRHAEILKVGGRSVSAPRIEEAIIAAQRSALLRGPAEPDLAGAGVAVVGVPDKTLGEVPCAIYTGEPPAIAGLRPDEAPRYVLPRHDLPRGPTGKLRRGLLAREAAKWTSAFPLTVAPDHRIVPAYALDPRACVADAGLAPWFGGSPPSRGRVVALVTRRPLALLATAYLEAAATHRLVAGPFAVDAELGDALRDVFAGELLRLVSLLPGDATGPVYVWPGCETRVFADAGFVAARDGWLVRGEDVGVELPNRQGVELGTVYRSSTSSS